MDRTGDRMSGSAVAAAMLDYHHDIGKWMIASLFVLNAAPLAALSQSRLAVPAIPCIILLFGIYNALSSAFFSWLNAGKRAEIMAPGAIGATAGSGRASRLRTMERAIVRLALHCPTRWTIAFGMVSTACFFAGSLWIAIAIATA